MVGLMIADARGFKTSVNHHPSTAVHDSWYEAMFAFHQMWHCASLDLPLQKMLFMTSCGLLPAWHVCFR